MSVYYAEYWTDSGRLQREGTDDLKPAPGCAVVAFDTLPDRTATVWDETLCAFVAPTAEVPPIRTAISKMEFLRDRLGLSVVAGTLAREASDPRIAVFRMLIDNADAIHLDDPVTVAGVQYLESLKLLTPEDVVRVLAP